MPKIPVIHRAKNAPPVISQPLCFFTSIADPHTNSFSLLSDDTGMIVSHFRC